MSRCIIFVHGRSFKPNEAALKKLWLAAIRAGIARDTPRKLSAFDAAKKDLAYFGDLSNRFLRSRGRRYAEKADIKDREKSLELLKAYPKDGFTKRAYRKIHRKTALKEIFVDALAGPARVTGLSGVAIRAVAPDIRHYWNMDAEYGSDIRERLSGPLRRAMNRGDRIFVIAHSLGSMVAYDTLWKFSRMSEYRKLFGRKIDLFVTLGSPLGDETVKNRIRGSGATGLRRFPANIRTWVNVAAEDDYISHDQRLAGDYRKIRELGTEIRDAKRIFNLSVRKGESNPHSSLGYLIHPTVIELITNWV